MNLRNSVTTAFAAVALIAAPVAVQVAQAQTSVSKLSVRSAPSLRSGASVSKGSKQSEGGLSGGTIIVAVVAVAVVGLGIAAAADGNSTPRSPN